MAAVVILQLVLGLIWVGIVLLGRSLRDCPFMESCNGTTSAESVTDLVVFGLGGVSWVAVTAYVYRSFERTGSYWRVLLAPAWFVLAVCASVAALTLTDGPHVQSSWCFDPIGVMCATEDDR